MIIATQLANSMINRGGAKIDPADVEAALIAHPAVAEAAVFGIPDRAAGQAVAACVVLEDGTAVTARELRSWLRSRLPVHARPRELHVVRELPRERTGKIDKAALRAGLAAGRGRREPGG